MWIWIWSWCFESNQPFCIFLPSSKSRQVFLQDFQVWLEPNADTTKLKSQNWSHKGSQCKAIARPCGQPHWSTRCLTLLMDWVMSNNPKVIRTFDACSRHSCRYRGEGGAPVSMSDTFSKLIVCLTAAEESRDIEMDKMYPHVVEKLYPTRHLAKFGVPDPIPS